MPTLAVLDDVKIAYFENAPSEIADDPENFLGTQYQVGGIELYEVDDLGDANDLDIDNEDVPPVYTSSTPVQFNEVGDKADSED